MNADPRGNVLGLRRLGLILRTADPEPIEFGNLFFLAIMVATYFPRARAWLYDPLHVEAAVIFALIGSLVIPLAVYAILWQPGGLLRRVTLMVKAAVWTFIAAGVASSVGAANIRTAFCLALIASSLWAAWRVGQQPS